MNSMVDIPVLLIMAVVFLIIGGAVMGMVVLRSAVITRLTPELEEADPNRVLQPTERTMTPTMSSIPNTASVQPPINPVLQPAQPTMPAPQTPPPVTNPVPIQPTMPGQQPENSTKPNE